MGKFGRFQGTSQNFSFTLTPDKIKKWFGGGDDKERKKRNGKDDEEGIDTDVESNVDDTMVNAQRSTRKKSGGGKAETDADGYMRFNMPWSLTFGYGITMRENTGGKFNTKTMRYPYKFSQNLNVSGNLRLSDGWNISFSSGYDFDQNILTTLLVPLNGIAVTRTLVILQCVGKRSSVTTEREVVACVRSKHYGARHVEAMQVALQRSRSH
jgi:hypothetical protein